ncbi:MAG: hypothetical protein ACOC6E_00505 [Thermodesulfobacteriota bacterium]
MKTYMIILVVVLISLFTMGEMCFAVPKAEDETTSKQVSKEVKEALEAVKQYSAEQRDEALNKVGIAIENLDARIADLEKRMEQKWDSMDQAAREKARDTLKSMRQKRNNLAEWYGGMKHSSSQAWKHVKEGFLKSYDALLGAYDKAKQEF